LLNWMPFKLITHSLYRIDKAWTSESSLPVIPVCAYRYDEPMECACADNGCYPEFQMPNADPNPRDTQVCCAMRAPAVLETPTSFHRFKRFFSKTYSARPPSAFHFGLYRLG
jgi:hypothetical protein